VCLNTMIWKNRAAVREAAKAFGSQAIVASIDYSIIDNRPIVFVNHKQTNTGVEVTEFARIAEENLAGEILLNSIDRDGTARGYDIETIVAVTEAVSIPVIACGGAGHQSHFKKCFTETQASGVAAGNIFHFTENAYPRAKEFLMRNGCDLR
jgi:cyclase